MEHFSKTITLKDGQSCLLRAVEIKDAKEIIDFTVIVAEKSKFLIALPDEINFTRWNMQSRLKGARLNPLSFYIVAVVDGKIIGAINTNPQKRARVRHAVDFGIAILPPYQGLGLGKAMIGEMINWAQAHPVVSRIDLHVHGQNIGAIGLYEKLGFQHEGVHKNAIRYEDGTFMDDITMAILL